MHTLCAWANFSCTYKCMLLLLLLCLCFALLAIALTDESRYLTKIHTICVPASCRCLSTFKCMLLLLSVCFSLPAIPLTDESTHSCGAAEADCMQGAHRTNWTLHIAHYTSAKLDTGHYKLHTTHCTLVVTIWYTDQCWSCMINSLSWQWSIIIAYDQQLIMAVINDHSAWSTVDHGNDQWS